jgi:membrane-bound metal-dependent hydrolase YbcI (DUF457 family)
VSWAAHEIESYFLQKHLKVRVSYLAILLGCLLPDFFTKLPVYGLHFGNMTVLKASFPAKYHRGWPGVGFTHSLAFGVVIALLVLWRTKNRGWALGLLIGVWAHVLTDMFDSVGTMVFFPFTTQHYSTDMWAYASQQGRYGDAAAYYSSLGGVWDFLWLCLALSGFKVFSRDFFFKTVVPNDRVWPWMKKKFAMSERAMLAVYRAYFVYGACRIFAWFTWSRFLNPERGKQGLDWKWGGPYWVEKVSFPAHDWGDWLANTARGAALMAVALYLIWRLLGRRLWAAAPELAAPPAA